jgi:hypothetical protein
MVVNPQSVGKVTGDDKIYGTEEAVAKVIVQLMRGEQNIKVMTDLNDEEVAYISVLSTIADKYDLGMLKQFIDDFCQFRISRYRYGRSELVNIAGVTLAPDIGKARGVKDIYGGLGKG